MLFKVEIVKLIDVFYVFHVLSATAAIPAGQPPYRRRLVAVPRVGNTLNFSFSKVSTIVAR